MHAQAVQVPEQLEKPQARQQLQSEYVSQSVSDVQVCHQLHASAEPAPPLAESAHLA